VTTSNNKDLYTPVRENSFVQMSPLQLPSPVNLASPSGEKQRILPQVFERSNFEFEDFEVILLIDNRERWRQDRDWIQKKLKKKKVYAETRSLPIGDFVWIARNKRDSSKEFVLDLICERKRSSDLASSIKDDRYKEQKFRLREFGQFQRLIYLVEGSVKCQDILPAQALLQAIAKTDVFDKFLVLQTKDLKETITLLVNLTKCLVQDLKRKSESLNVTYEQLKLQCKKKSAPNSKLQFGCMLRMISGVSSDKAFAIINKYPTLRELYRCFLNDGEGGLKDLEFGKKKKTIGISVSKKVYGFFMAKGV